MGKLTKLFVKIVSGVTLLAILAAAVFIVPQIWGWEPYIVRSGSMEPAVHTGAITFINTRSRDWGIGDIITYRLEGRDEEILITHRVVGREGDEYVTKGDANEVPDLALVRPDQVVGRYVFQIPKAGFLADRWNSGGLAAAVFWIVLLNGMAVALEAANSGNGVSDKEETGKESGTKCC